MASFSWDRASPDRDMYEKKCGDAGVEEDSRGKGKVRTRPAASAMRGLG
jgi:hypothetical protein